MMKNKYLLKSDKILVKPQNEEDLWGTAWDILLNEGDNRKIGYISFEGEKYSGTIPISVELDEYHRDKGYGTRAIRLMTDWAFLHSNIYEVETFTDPENDAYIFALEKAGYVYRGHMDDGKDRYSKEKQPTSWLGLYVVIGIAVGAALGIVIDIPWVGIVVGLFAGIVIGRYMDSQVVSAREKVTGKNIRKEKKMQRETAVRINSKGKGEK